MYQQVREGPTIQHIKLQISAHFKSSTTLTGMYSFLENFVPNAGCYTRMGEYGNQWVRDVGGKWHEMTTARFTQDATANKQVRLNYTGGVRQENKFCLKNCGFCPQTPLVGRTLLSSCYHPVSPLPPPPNSKSYMKP